MATGTVILIYDEFESSVEPQRREEYELIHLAQETRAQGLTVGNTEVALQLPYEVDHPFTFPILRNGEPAYVGKASWQTYSQLTYLVNRGWSLIGNDLIILSGELKEQGQLERVKNILGMAQSFYSPEEVAEVA